MELTYFYLMQTDDDQKPLVKVGITWNMRVRKRGLQTKRKRKLKIVASRTFDSANDAFHVEQAFHRAHQVGYNRSEWYPYSPEIVFAFLTHRVAGQGSTHV